MENLGWELVFHKPKVDELLDKKDILALCDGLPDVLVVADMSRPPFVLDVESMPWHTVFYAVDTHIHSWFPLYGAAFDACMVSLKDAMPAFCKILPADSAGERVWWFPPYAPEKEQYSLPDTMWDCLFLGTVDAHKTPDRVRFLEAVGKLIPLEVQQGRFMELFPKAKVLLNFCEHGDLNFRVFEAMGAGRPLVTPLVENGLTDLFSPGEDCQVYTLGTTPEESALYAAEGIRFLLDNPPKRENMGAKALATIDARHRAHHRAKELDTRLRTLCACPKRPISSTVRTTLRFLYLHEAESLPESNLKARYVQAALRLVKK